MISIYNDLNMVFERLNKHRFTLNMDKCKILQKEVKFLGHIITADGYKSDPEKVKIIKDWPAPTNKKQLLTWIGICSYYRKFVRNFTVISNPLFRLTKNDVKFVE